MLNNMEIIKRISKNYQSKQEQQQKSLVNKNNL